MWLACHENAHFDYAPTPTSWLNQAEFWFSILVGKSLIGASFKAVDALKTPIDAFIKDNGETAGPFV